MIAIVPVMNQGASSLLTPLRIVFEKLGPNDKHRLLVACDPRFLETGQEFAEALKRLFADVTVVNITVEKLREGSHNFRTEFFRRCLAGLHQSGNQDPIVWLEHAVPTCPGWLDTLTFEWERKPADRFFLGRIEKLVIRAKDPNTGELLLDPPRFVDKGLFMRFGVYPPDVLDRVNALSYRNTGESFEMLIRNEVVPFCQPSVAMTSIWASRDWTREGHQLIGKQDPNFESEYRKNAKTRVEDDEVVLIHGCRDASLAFLISKKTFREGTRTGEKGTRGVVESATSEKELSELRIRIKELEEENDRLRDRVSELEHVLEDLDPSDSEDDGSEGPSEESEEFIDIPGEEEEELVEEEDEELDEEPESSITPPPPVQEETPKPVAPGPRQRKFSATA